MLRRFYLFLISVFLLFSFIFAQNPPSKKNLNSDTIGDSPLTTSYVWEGNGGVLIVPLAFEGVVNPTGTLVVDSLPTGSEVIYACFASTSWQGSFRVSSAIFNSIELIPILPTYCDRGGGFDLCSYRWDVTSIINGNNSYSFSCSNLEHSYLVYLVIIYQNPSSPMVMISLNDGAESLDNSSSTTNFFGFSNGNGMVSILTQAGNTGGSGESIVFNGIVLAEGDVFTGNLGAPADYHVFNLSNIQSEDSLTITTLSDWIGIHLAVLTGPPGEHPPLNVTIAPYNPPVQIPAGGGSFSYSLLLENPTTTGIHYHSWLNAILPNGNIFGPIHLRNDQFISPNCNITWDSLSQYVPATAPGGNYAFTANAGLYPNVIYASDTLFFEKLADDNFPHLNQGEKPTFSNTAVLSEYLISNAYPNPFNQQTTITLSLPIQSNLQLAIYNLQGQMVAQLFSGIISAGVYRFNWNAENQPSGIYFYECKTNMEIKIGRIMLLK